MTERRTETRRCHARARCGGSPHAAAAATRAFLEVDPFDRAAAREQYVGCKHLGERYPRQHLVARADIFVFLTVVENRPADVLAGRCEDPLELQVERVRLPEESQKELFSRRKHRNIC